MDVKDVFYAYQYAYKKILERIYPSLGSTGFTEQNQTVNFIEAYKKKHSDCAAWFEFPCPMEKKCHYDAILVDYNQNSIFVIEAKRVTVERKIKSMEKDIERINRFYDNMLIENGKRIENIEKYEIYGIVLADIWLCGDEKRRYRRDIYDSFKEGKYWGEEKLAMTQCFCSDEKNPVYETDNETYHLLALVWKIVKPSTK